MNARRSLSAPTAVVVVLWALSGVAAARAEDPSLQDLDQKIRVLERKLELSEEAARAREKTAPVVTAGAGGFSLASADKAFHLKLRGYTQFDARFFVDDEADASDTFLLRRVRPILEGILYEDFDFRVMPDFGGGSTVLQDAYLGYTASPGLKLRAGKFKPPFGLERLQSGTSTFFVERAHPTSLAPNRDMGLQVSGDLLDGTLSYEVGAFNGVTDGGSGDSDTNDGKDFVGRLFAHPFQNSGLSALSGLGLGIAASVGDNEGSGNASGLPSFRTPGQTRFFSYRTSTNAADNVVADGERIRLSPQAYYFHGPFGALVEFVTSEQDVRRGDQEETLQNEAWQVAVGYVLTGEDSTYKGVSPRSNFKPSAGQWGALELVARLSELSVDSATFPTYANPASQAESIQSWAVGLNWYLNKGLKASLDCETSTFDGGAAEDADRADEQVLLARLQVSF